MKTAKKRKPITVCKWLREHAGSVKPVKDERIQMGLFTYWRLSNGQIVSEMTARKMGL